MLGIISGNVKAIAVISVSLSPALVAQSTTAEQDVTVTGVLPGDYVFVNKPTAQAGLGIVGARVKSANTVSLTFANVPAGGNITPTATESYVFLIVRPESATLPSAVNV